MTTAKVTMPIAIEFCNWAEVVVIKRVRTAAPRLNGLQLNYSGLTGCQA